MEKNEDSCGPVSAQGPLVPAKKVRQSNMELLRLLSMLFVIMLHANYFSLKGPVLADWVAAPLPTFSRMFFEHLAIVAVDVFVLISGWFGIRPKWKGLANLMFQVMFFSVGVLLVFLAAGQSVPTKTILKLLYPGEAYWFVVAYMGLYLLSPMLNMFVERVTRRRLGLFLVAFFTWEFFYGFIYDRGLFGGGYTAISFVGLYLLAQYVRRYPSCWTGISNKYLLLIYLLTVLTGVFSFLLLLQLGHPTAHSIAYNSPLVILGSLALVLLFSRLRLQSRFINRMAASCFSIYLLHLHPLIVPYFKSFFVALYTQFNGIAYLSLALLCLLAIGLACILADQVRLFCWQRFLPLLERLLAPVLRRMSL